jgi:hypothetical protein
MKFIPCCFIGRIKSVFSSIDFMVISKNTMSSSNFLVDVGTAKFKFQQFRVILILEYYYKPYFNKKLIFIDEVQLRSLQKSINQIG